jgi:dinuclear metal center YbgI/SA1388 family protein
MENWAPSWLAEPWDNVGLLAGREDAIVEEVWVALEADAALLEKAGSKPARMLLLHHPPIFEPLKNLRCGQPVQAALLKAAAAGLNIFAAHTNLDAAWGGVSHALAERLGLKNLQPLLPREGGHLLKLAVFVPVSQTQALSQALFAAGAGRLGHYQECSFAGRGTGQFRPGPEANPSLGRRGALSRVEETRLEVMLPQSALAAAVAAIHRVHPYEEPAYDIIPLLNRPAGVGWGQVGDLTEAEPGEVFLREAARKLACPAPQYAGPLPERVSRVAVLGGSGGMGLKAAAAAGAQVFVTGESGHHSASLASDLNICLFLAGHYASEAVMVEPWARRLGRELKRAGLSCRVRIPRVKSMWQWL